MPNGTIPPRRRPGTGPAPSGPRKSGASAAARRPAPAEGGPKLVCTAGPKAGSEFPLTGEEVVVGRAADAGISIPDTSVSRRHLKLTPVGPGWAVADLGSGNGTEVNGRKIEEETPLRNGDVLTLGDTELAFVDSANTTDRRALPVARPSSVRASPRASSGGAALARRTTSGPRSRGPGGVPVRSRARQAQDPEALKRKKMLQLGGVGMALLVVVVFAVVHHLQKTTAIRVRAHQLQLQQNRLKVAEIFQQGIGLVRDGNWVDAMARFEQVKKIAPEYPAVDQYLARGKIEVPNQKHVAEAAKALKADQLGAAAKALAKVDNTQLAAFSTVTNQLSAKMPVRLKAAQDAFDQKRFKDAIAISTDLLAAFPDNRDAKLLQTEATQAQYKIDHPPPPPPPPPKRPWRAVIARYDGGDLTGAVAMANACAARHFRPCRTLMKEMSKFAALNRGVGTASLRQLEQIVKLDVKIADDPDGSKLARPARTRAAGMLYQKAVSAKLGGRWGSAFDYANRALKMRPSHAAAQAIVHELKSKAHDLYLSAYTTMHTTPDQALRKFEAVAKMTPSGSDLHEKAERRIAEIQQR